LTECPVTDRHRDGNRNRHSFCKSLPQAEIAAQIQRYGTHRTNGAPKISQMQARTTETSAPKASLRPLPRRKVKFDQLEASSASQHSNTHRVYPASKVVGSQKLQRWTQNKPGVGLPGCLLTPWFAVQGASARAIDHRSWTEAAADLRETTLIPSRCPADCEDGFTARYLHTPNQQEGGCCLCPEAPGGPPPRAPAHTKFHAEQGSAVEQLEKFLKGARNVGEEVGGGWGGGSWSPRWQGGVPFRCWTASESRVQGRL